jgi:hypothetical protein
MDRRAAELERAAMMPTRLSANHREVRISYERLRQRTASTEMGTRIDTDQVLPAGFRVFAARSSS